MKVSIIMPVYNAEKTLQRSLDSIKAQTFRDFEVVFADDCSTDGTGDMIKEFSESSGIPCRIVRAVRNGGVAAARNLGLENARGEFLAFVDADDTIEPEALEKAVNAADEADADIVGWDWTLGFEKNGRYMRQYDYSTPLEALKHLMGGTMRWNLWLFMFRRSLVEDIRFIPGANMGEDMMFTIKAFLKARKVTQIHESLYGYNAVSTTSISRQFSEERRAEVTRNIKETETAVDASEYSEELRDYVQYLKLYIKLPLLVSPDEESYRIWYSWFDSANAYATKNKALPLRTRLLQWMAARSMWTGVKIYHLLVYKFVYGVIYR